MTTSSLTLPVLISFFLLCYSRSFLLAQDPATLPVELVYLDGGSFTMGCVAGRDDINGLSCDSDESPAHTVTLRDFHIGKYEVTQGQYQAIMGDNPSFFSACGLDCPVEQVNWYATIIFCNELTLQDASLNATERCYYRDAAMTEPWTIAHYSSADGDPASGDVYFDESRRGYRLPTEAEWEYVARGGIQSQGYQFAGSNTIDEIAWYTSNSQVTYEPNWSGRGTHPVGGKTANELGIYDMTGNVWEWGWDNVFDGNYLLYSADAQCNPYGTPNGLWFNGPFGHTSDTCCPVVRGGSWNFTANDSRLSNRFNYNPHYQLNLIGFRLSRYP